MSSHELDTRVLRSKEGYAEVQKRTFTKWVNSNLGKKGLKVDDLYVDLRDGSRIIALLEVISGDRLPRPDKGKGRFVMAGNVNKALTYIRYVRRGRRTRENEQKGSGRRTSKRKGSGRRTNEQKGSGRRTTSGKGPDAGQQAQRARAPDNEHKGPGRRTNEHTGSGRRTNEHAGPGRTTRPVSSTFLVPTCPTLLPALHLPVSSLAALLLTPSERVANHFPNALLTPSERVANPFVLLG